MRILLVAILAIHSASAFSLFAEDPANRDLAGEVIGTLVKSLNDQDAKVRAAAKLALANLQAMAVPQLVKTVKSGGAQRRTTVLEVLLEIGAEAKEAVPTLVNVLYTDANERNRSLAERALEEISDRRLEVQPLIALLQRDDKAVRRLAVVNALANIGPPARSAAAQLLDELNRDDERVRRAVMNALSQTGVDDAHAKTAVEALVKALDPKREPRQYNRAAAANALGALGSQAKDACGSLIAAYRAEKSAYNKKTILGSLGSIGVKTAEVVATLKKATTHDSERGIRRYAVEALRRRSEEGKLIFLNEEDLIPILIEALKDDSKILEESRAAADALVEIGAPAVPHLAKALQSTDAGTRVAAAYALGKIGRLSQPALATLIKTMQDDGDEDVRQEAIRAAAQILAAKKE